MLLNARRYKLLRKSRVLPLNSKAFYLKFDRFHFNLHSFAVFL